MLVIQIIYLKGRSFSPHVECEYISNNFYGNYITIQFGILKCNTHVI